MATFVLVHGGSIATETWNRLTNRNRYPPGGLLGGKCWDDQAAFLRKHGHDVFSPDLADEHIHNLTYHIDQIRRLVDRHNLRNVVLVGHSYGGMVITGAADRMPKRIRRMVYVDAALPDPGESLFDQFARGGADPLSFAGLEAAKAYGEKIRFNPRTIRVLKKTYIRCTKSEFLNVTRVAQERITAAPEGWRYLELPTSHVPMATMPGRTNRLLLEAAYR